MKNTTAYSEQQQKMQYPKSLLDESQKSVVLVATLTWRLAFHENDGRRIVCTLHAKWHCNVSTNPAFYFAENVLAVQGYIGPVV